MNKNKQQRKRQLWAYVGLGMICLLVIGVLINIIGNVSIRSNDVAISRIAMHVINPLQAGVHTVIRWDTPSTVSAQQMQIAVRSKDGIAVLAETSFFAGVATIQIPCTATPGTGSIELLSAQNKSVVAWSTITIIPAGPDCVR